jgi:hypothetical protein
LTRNKYVLWIGFGNFSVPAVKQIVHKKCNLLVQGIPGNIKPDELVNECIWFGVWADRNTEPAVRSDCFPIREALFLMYGPVSEITAVRLVIMGNGT